MNLVEKLEVKQHEIDAVIKATIAILREAIPMEPVDPGDPEEQEAWPNGMCPTDIEYQLLTRTDECSFEDCGWIDLVDVIEQLKFISKFKDIF